MVLAIKLLVWLLAPLVNAWKDRKGHKPNYLIVNILRGIAVIFHGSLFIPDTAWTGWWPYFWPVLIFQITSFFLVFNTALYFYWNHYHPDHFKPLFYYDSKEGDSGLTDRIFKALGKWGPLAYRLTWAAAALLLVFSTVAIYNRHA